MRIDGVCEGWWIWFISFRMFASKMGGYVRAARSPTPSFIRNPVAVELQIAALTETLPTFAFTHDGTVITNAYLKMS